MKVYVSIFVLTIAFIMGFVVDSSVAKAPISKTRMGHEMSQLLWSDVKNPQGEYLGMITDFIVGPSGRIEFAILLQRSSKSGDGRSVAVPFDALSYGPSAHQFILNTTSERLASAPGFDPNKSMTNPEFAEDSYRSFGLAPQWTEQGHENWRRSDQDPFDLVG